MNVNCCLELASVLLQDLLYRWSLFSLLCVTYCHQWQTTVSDMFYLCQIHKRVRFIPLYVVEHIMQSGLNLVNRNSF